MSRRWMALFALALALSVAVDFALEKEPYEYEYWWTHTGFFAWYGLVSCVAIILISKRIGRHLLQRPEGYYDEGGSDDR